MKPELNQTVCVVCSAVGDIVAAGVIPDVRSFEWSADARCLYYCLADEHGRPSKVWLTACLSGCQAMLLPVWFWKSSLVTAFMVAELHTMKLLFRHFRTEACCTDGQLDRLHSYLQTVVGTCRCTAATWSMSPVEVMMICCS